MRWLRQAWWRLIEPFAATRRERELDAELSGHLQMHVDDQILAGVPAEEAERRAQLALGGMDQTKERCRDQRGFPTLDTLLQDVRYAGRTLRRSPTFTLVALCTLALGIGANSAMFSIVDAVLLRPLPFPAASRLVAVWATNTRAHTSTDVASFPDYADWRSSATSFEAMAAYATRSLLLVDGSGADLLRGLRVAPSFFDTIGVQPALGRAFRDVEQEPGASEVVILSDGLWRRRFGADPAIVGRTVRIDDRPCTIVGVTPAGFQMSPTEPEELYAPLVRDPNRGHGFLRVVGRLRSGTTITAAQAELDVITRRLAAAYPRTDANVGASVVPLVNAVAGPARPGLLILLGVVALVLLIACANVANLLLARTSARQRELSVRAALGAGRGRIVRQLLTETLLLPLTGGVLGLGIAQWTMPALIGLLGSGVPVPRLQQTAIDGRVLAFTLLVSTATGVLFGVVPAFSAASGTAAEALRESNARPRRGHDRGDSGAAWSSARSRSPSYCCRRPARC